MSSNWFLVSTNSIDIFIFVHLGTQIINHMLDALRFSRGHKMNQLGSGFVEVYHHHHHQVPLLAFVRMCVNEPSVTEIGKRNQRADKHP